MEASSEHAAILRDGRMADACDLLRMRSECAAPADTVRTDRTSCRERCAAASKHDRVGNAAAAASLAVLLIADLFQPVHGPALDRFLDGDMRHRRRRRCAVPVLLAGRKPDHVARPDLLDRAALALRPAAAERDDQGLAERMGMPGGASARLERYAGAADACGIG